jgi:uroporphyrinogen-III synthase
LPEDIEPLRRVVRAVCHGQVDVLVFTSASQIQHVMQVAEMMSLKSEFLDGTCRCVIASAAPACTEELKRQGFPADVQPSRSHTGPLFQEIAQKSHSLLRSKRG